MSKTRASHVKAEDGRWIDDFQANDFLATIAESKKY